MRSLRLIPLLALLIAACQGPPAAVLENQAALSSSTENGASAPRVAGNAAAAPRERDTTAPVLTAEGFGPLRIGMTLAEVNQALGPDSDPEAVGGPDPDSCDQFRPERAPAGMLVMIEDRRLTSISLIDDAAVRTDRGLGIGDTAAAVTAVYGTAVQRERHKYQDPPAAYLTVWTRGGPGVSDGVSDPAARGIRYEVGANGRVESIHAGGPSIQYVEGCA